MQLNQALWSSETFSPVTDLPMTQVTSTAMREEAEGEGHSVSTGLHVKEEVQLPVKVHGEEEEEPELVDYELLNGVFARFQEAMQMNWSALADITGKASELEAALHKKLKKGCKDAFKHYFRIYENNVHSWAVVIEKFLTKSYLVDKANWNYLKKARFAKYCKTSNLQWLESTLMSLVGQWSIPKYSHSSSPVPSFGFPHQQPMPSRREFSYSCPGLTPSC